MRRLRSTVAAPVALLLGLGLLAACSAGEDEPDADALAEAYESGEFGEVEFSGPTTAAVEKQYARITEGLSGLEPEVTAGEVALEEGTASVPLQWSWSTGDADREWSYETEVALTQKGEEWEATWEPATVQPDLAGPHDVLRAQRVLADRGAILGARDEALVRPRPVVTFGIDKARVPDTAAAIRSGRLLAQALGVDVADFVASIRAAGDDAFVEAITYRKGEAPVSPAEVADILGALAIPGTRELAPTREFAAPILGEVGPVTAEIMEEHPDTYRVGDDAGLSGLQARYDDQLRGTPGVLVEVLHGEDGEDGVEDAFEVPAEAGSPLHTTLDSRLQRLAERTLADVRPASALVAVRPSDGAILAAANGPGTNGVNIATYGQAPPGSTFKTATTLAMLRSGLTPNATVQCPPNVTVDGRAFRNDSWYPSSALGSVPLATAIANSCNTALIGKADDVDHAALVDAAGTLGFGIDHDLGFSAYFGQLPDPGSATGHAAELIGQGQVLASPMAMATMIGSIQAGETVVPQLVTGVDGLETAVPDDVTPLSKTEADQLRQIFRGVVTEGSGAGLAEVPGPPVIAKTGTAEFDRDGRRLTHTWMVAAQGDLAVAVFVDVGVRGSITSGPILEEFLRGR